MNPLLDTLLIDGSTITTDTVTDDGYRTVHTRHGVSNEIASWPTELDARQGHARTVRELTATITTEERRVVRH